MARTRSWRPRSTGGADTFSGTGRFPSLMWTSWRTTSAGKSPTVRQPVLMTRRPFSSLSSDWGTSTPSPREFAREHSERLWKQLILMPEGSDNHNATPWRELVLVLTLAVGAGAAVKAGFAWIDDGAALTRNLGLLTFPFLAAYFAWKRRITGAVAAALIVPFAGLAVALNLYPFTAFGATGTLAALHAPVILWLLTGLAYVEEDGGPAGAAWTSSDLPGNSGSTTHCWRSAAPS